MPLVEFIQAGKWAENDTNVPQFRVLEGEVRECSQELADIIVNADKGIIVNSDVGNNANVDTNSSADAGEENPAKKDKKEAEINKPYEDKKKSKNGKNK